MARIYIFSVLLFTLLLTFAFPPAVFCQNSTLDYYSVVDWQTGELVINLETRFPPGTDSLGMRNLSEDLFKRSFFDIFINSIKRDRSGIIYYNSMNTVEEGIQKNPAILSRIDDISNNIIRVYSAYNHDMANVSMQYKLDIYRDIAGYFITHTIPVMPEETMLWASSADYTGVVIYAAGEYPVHGENALSRLNPALFPAVYDENMRKVLSVEMVKPEVISSSGPVTYLRSADESLIKKYAGDNPMYTMARKVFGKYRTDILIPAADADRLFYNGRNTSLAREGWFVIITGQP